MRKILIVDDEIMNLVLEEHALSGQYEVLKATSGKEALHCLETERPDMILLDIEMPGMSGMEVAKIMKADLRYKDIPIVFLTADLDPETEEECFEIGADEFVIKPFIPVVVQKRIERVFELREFREMLKDRLEQREQR